MNASVREELAQKKPLLFDGAMGTCYAALFHRPAEFCEMANLERPDEIRQIHRAYLDAGCRAIKTNTFSAGGLFARGDAALGATIVERGFAIAREAAGPYGAWVFADLGPVPEGFGKTAQEVFQVQAEEFLRAGAACFLLETLSSDRGVAEFARWLKTRCPEAFLLVSFAVDPQGMTGEGLSGAELYRRAAGLPEVDAAGFNCMSGPRHLLKFAEGLEKSGKPLSVMPNAGYPSIQGRRVIYQGSAAYFAGQMTELVRAGADIVGGCCGTTPGHIASLAARLQEAVPRVSVSPPAPEPEKPDPGGSNPLWDKLSAGERAIAVELDPPSDDVLAPFLDGARVLRDAGADAVTVADSPVGRPRADSSLIACKLKRELGVEPLPHMACRDRNLIATKALLLGLSMEGVHNVLLVTGDPIPTADRNEVKSVFNFNSRKLARYVSSLNETLFHTPFRIYGALNLNALNFSVELELAREKEKNGVSAFLTQPILSREALDNLKRARDVLNGKILAGVFPVVSYRNAVFLNNEVAGVRVCDEIVRLYEGKDKAEGESLAERISVEIIRAAAPCSDGLYLMTPFRRVALMSRLIRAAREA